MFISGLFLGSGPCLSFCAPILASYSASHPAGLKKSTISYLVFSAFKLISYALLGIICAAGTKLLQNQLLEKYLSAIFLTLGCFIILIGITTLFYQETKMSKICGWLHKGNIKNVGILGLLIGLSPCLPLLAILNYILIISKDSFQALIFSLSFGLGTVLSPLLIVVMLSAGISQKLSKNNRLKVTIRTISALVLLILGGRIILRILQH